MYQMLKNINRLHVWTQTYIFSCSCRSYFFYVIHVNFIPIFEESNTMVARVWSNWWFSAWRKSGKDGSETEDIETRLLLFCIWNGIRCLLQVNDSTRVKTIIQYPTKWVQEKLLSGRKSWKESNHMLSTNADTYLSTSHKHPYTRISKL